MKRKYRHFVVISGLEKNHGWTLMHSDASPYLLFTKQSVSISGSSPPVGAACVLHGMRFTLETV
jgi:hypothetical protein